MIKRFLAWVRRSEIQPAIPDIIPEPEPERIFFSFEATDDLVLYRTYDLYSTDALLAFIRQPYPDEHTSILLFVRDVEDFLIERGVQKVVEVSRYLNFFDTHSKQQDLLFQNDQDLDEFKLRIM